MINWSMKFQVIQPMATFPRPLCIEMETHDSAEYYRSGPSTQGDTYCYLQYTFAGRGVYNDPTGSYILTPGTSFIGDVTYSDYEYYYPEGANEPWVFIWFGFLGDSAKAAIAELFDRNGPICRLPADKGIIPALMKYKSYDGLTYELTPFDGMTLVTDTLAALAASRWSQHPQDSRSVLIRKARQIISDDLENPIRVADVADRLHISREHLSRIFKKHIGVTPQDYIMRQKILLACKLLKETTLSAKEISVRLGYDSPTHFTRAFKNLLHVPPTQFRQMRTNVLL